MGPSEKRVDLVFPGAEELHYIKRGDRAQVWGLGGPELLNWLQTHRPQIEQSPEKLALPTGSSRTDLILRQFILRIQGRWDPPFKEWELCHCFKIPTSRILKYILEGHHSVEAIALKCRAGTSCGRCRPDTQSLVEYHLNLGSESSR